MENEIFLEITDIMLSFGLQPKYIGFNYLRDAIEIFFNKVGNVEKLTVETYPKIAERYGVSVMVVERNIRIVIRNAYKSKGLLEINSYYGNVVYSGEETLSNGEVISIIAEILKLNRIKQKLEECD